MRNPFKQPVLRDQFDRVVKCYQERHRDIIRADGGRNISNAWGMNFWRGFDNNPHVKWDRDAKQTPAYACFRAGQEMAKVAK